MVVAAERKVGVVLNLLDLQRIDDIVGGSYFPDDWAQRAVPWAGYGQGCGQENQDCLGRSIAWHGDQ